MARWRLIEPHYLKVKGVTWEYQEVDRTSGRQTRKSFPVPQHFHPDTEADWTEVNGRGMGWIVVTDGHNSKPSDIVFEGEPTPGMECLDDEARKISDKYRVKWKEIDRPYAEEEGGYASRMMDRFIEEQGKVNLALAESRDIPGMGDFMRTMTDVMKQNQQIMMTLAEKSIAAELKIKPVVDDLEPLDPLDKFIKKAS
jgi:hypothetical protein